MNLKLLNRFSSLIQFKKKTLAFTVSRCATPEIVATQSGADRVSAECGNINMSGRFTYISTGNCKSGGGRQLPRICILGTGPILERATFVLCPASARG